MNLDDQSRTLLTRLYSAALFFAVACFAGAGGYQFIGAGRWTFYECLYMALITLSTVGFGEVLTDMDTVPYARTWTGVLILFGSGTVLYFVSTLTAFIVEGDLRGALRRNSMSRLLEKLNDHVIIVGAAATGYRVLREMVDTRTPCVLVDVSEARIERALLEVSDNILYVVGDATADDVLQAAQIGKAKGVITTLYDDRDNLFVTISARALNENVRIVASTSDPINEEKFKRAGADVVIAPAYIGGMRMASEMLRPSVVQFLDEMLRDPEHNKRIEEVLITAKSRNVGSCLRDLGIRQEANALVIAVRYLDGSHEYNPGPSLVLRAGMVLIVLADAAEVESVKRIVNME